MSKICCVFSWMMAMLILGGMTSCKDDDDEKNVEYIVTGQPINVGITYAVLTGDFYPDNMPSIYSPTLSTLRLGIEVSPTEDFNEKDALTFYSKELVGNRMKVSINGLSSQTDYYYRAFVDIGTMKLYGDTQRFTTSAMQLVCTVGDATNVTFNTANVNVSFDKSVQSLPSVDAYSIGYGIAYSTDKDSFSAFQAMKSYDNPERTMVFMKPLEYSDNDVTVVIDRLEPGRTYYYCAYTYVGGKPNVLFGPVKSFTTMAIEPSQLATLDATDVDFFSATLKATTTLPSLITRLYPAATNVSYGISYAPAAAYPDGSYNANEIFPNIAINATLSNDTIMARLTDLDSGTKYIFRPFVRFNSMVLTGDVKSFTTTSTEGLLTIESVNAKFIYAEVTGQTLLPQSVTGVTYTLSYATTGSDYPWSNGVAMTVDGNRLTAMAQSLGTGHSYECWITASKGGRTIMQSEKKVFMTLNPGDYILMDDATNITSTSAVINCKLSPVAFENETFAHVYFGKDKNNLTQLVVANLNGDHLTAKLTNLQPNTTYYFRGQALCTLSFGRADWYSSEIKSFTTLP